MSKQKPSVTTRNFGVKEFTVNVSSQDDAIDGILDAMSHIYWLFDDESNINFALELRYTKGDVDKYKRFEPYEWKNSLEGARDYLSKVGNACFKRLDDDVTSFIIELRFLDKSMTYLSAVTEDFHDKVVKHTGCASKTLEAMLAHPDDFKAQMKILMELNEI